MLRALVGCALGQTGQLWRAAGATAGWLQSTCLINRLYSVSDLPTASTGTVCSTIHPFTTSGHSSSPSHALDYVNSFLDQESASHSSSEGLRDRGTPSKAAGAKLERFQKGFTWTRHGRPGHPGQEGALGEVSSSLYKRIRFCASMHELLQVLDEYKGICQMSHVSAFLVRASYLKTPRQRQQQPQHADKHPVGSPLFTTLLGQLSSIMAQQMDNSLDTPSVVGLLSAHELLFRKNGLQHAERVAVASSAAPLIARLLTQPALLEQATAQELSSLARSLSLLRLRNVQVYDAIAAEAMQRAPDTFGVNDAAPNLLLALALSGQRYPELFATLCDHLVQQGAVAHMQLPALRSLLQACSASGFRDAGVLHALASSIRPYLPTLTPQELSETTRSLQQLDQLDSQLAEEVSVMAVGKMTTFPAHYLVVLLRALGHAALKKRDLRTGSRDVSSVQQQEQQQQQQQQGEETVGSVSGVVQVQGDGMQAIDTSASPTPEAEYQQAEQSMQQPSKQQNWQSHEQQQPQLQQHHQQHDQQPQPQPQQHKQPQHHQHQQHEQQQRQQQQRKASLLNAQLLNAAVPRLHQHTSALDAHDLITLAWLLAIDGRYNKPLFTAICQHLTPHIPQLDPKGLPTLCWALAKVGHVDRTLLASLSQACQPAVSVLGKQQVATIAQAIAALVKMDQQLLGAVPADVLDKLQLGNGREAG